MRSLKGISQTSLKRLSDSELEAIGLYREEMVGGDKYFEIRDDGRDRKVKEARASTSTGAILSRPEAFAIAQKLGFNGTGQNLYDWAKAAVTAKSEESKLSNREKLASVGLVAVFTPENKPAWQAKN